MDEGDGTDDVEAFCAHWYPRVHGMLTLYVGNRSIAEELTQDAFVRAWERWPSVSTMENPVGWVHVTALNLARSWFRRRSAWLRVRSKLGDSGVSEGPDPSDRIAVMEAIEALPHRQRQVVLLRYYLDMPTEEIADATGTAASTVRVHLSRALTRLRTAGLMEVSDV